MEAESSALWECAMVDERFRPASTVGPLLRSDALDERLYIAGSVSWRLTPLVNSCKRWLL